MNSRTCAEAAGVTYRQLDYWTRTGLLVETAAGCGSRRNWSIEDCRLVRLFGLLSGAERSLSSADRKVSTVRLRARRLLAGAPEEGRWTGFLVLCADGEVLRCPTGAALLEALDDGVQHVQVVVLDDIAEAVSLRVREAA